MAQTQWTISKIIVCPTIGQEAVLIERRHYSGARDTQGEPTYSVQASYCSHDIECNLNDHIHCRWSFKGEYDPFIEIAGLELTPSASA